MSPLSSSQGIIRFGDFDVDPHSGELRKHGLRIKLQVQPFQVLQILLEHPGEVITREELQKRIWPADTFVDFDQGLNNAVKKLRGPVIRSLAERCEKVCRCNWNNPLFSASCRKIVSNTRFV